MRVEDQCAACGVGTLTWKADVSNFSECKIMLNAAVEEFGSIDILVNNAGVTQDGLLVRMGEEQFDQVIAANLKSAFNMTRLVGAQMFKQKSGRIVNISSVVGLRGNAGQVNYAASKAGIVGLTLSAAKELGPRGITVNAVAPGFIETEMTDALPAAVKAEMLERISLGRYGSPEDVAGAVAFLTGADSAYITGQVIVVDGGMA